MSVAPGYLKPTGATPMISSESRGSDLTADGLARLSEVGDRPVVADDRDGGAILLLGPEAPRCWCGAEHAEEIRRRELDESERRFAFGNDTELAAAVVGHRVEDVALRAPVVRSREPMTCGSRKAAVLPERLDGDDAIGRGIGKRRQQHAVDEREDGGVGSDAERERDDDRKADDRRAHDRPERVADVLAQLVEPGERLLLAEMFPQLFDAAEGPARGAPRFVRRHTLRLEPLLQQPQMSRRSPRPGRRLRTARLK